MVTVAALWPSATIVEGLAATTLAMILHVAGLRVTGQRPSGAPPRTVAPSDVDPGGPRLLYWRGAWFADELARAGLGASDLVRVLAAERRLVLDDVVGLVITSDRAIRVIEYAAPRPAPPSQPNARSSPRLRWREARRRWRG